MFRIGLIIALAYLLGSIPTSVWLGRALKGVDLREHGSGNAGATNAFRVLGKGIGTIVLLLDMLKGFLAVNLVLLQNELDPGTEALGSPLFWVIYSRCLQLSGEVRGLPRSPG